MKNNIENIIRHFGAIKKKAFSNEGYGVYEFEIARSNLDHFADKEIYSSTALFGHSGTQFYVNDFAFYAENEDTVKKFNTLVSNKQKNKANATEKLLDFVNEHKECFIDTKLNPIKTLDYWESNMYRDLSDPKKYQEMQQKMDIGVCHLIRHGKVYTFRIPTQQVSPGNYALKGYYTKPINTKEDLAKHMSVVNKLFDQDKLEYEVMLTGVIAKECIDNIVAQQAKLPNNYEYEQICILKKYAKIQDYPIEFSINKNGKHTATMTTNDSVVQAQLGVSEDNPLIVSYDDKKNIKMDLAQFVEQFYYDKTKDKINELVKKVKMK